MSSKRINPASLLAALNGDFKNAMVAATPGGIEAQERAGQISSNKQSTLPKKMRGCTRADLEALGFLFGADFDDLFVSVTFPAGWSKRGNAQLIAAAPNLLRALQLISAPFDAARECGMHVGEATIKSDSEMLRVIRAAINKATGEKK